MNIVLTRPMADILIYLRNAPVKTIRMRGVTTWGLLLAPVSDQWYSSRWTIFYHLITVKEMLRLHLLRKDREFSSKYKPLRLTDLGRDIVIPPLELLDGEPAVFS